jgi:SAM-dependent methyltransferase
VFGGVSDDFWFWLNTEGMRRIPLLREILPGMPDPEVQISFTGTAGDKVLEEGFLGYRLFRAMYERHVGTLSNAEILDYGCGWGRIIRFWLRDVRPSQIAGMDPVPEMIELCRRTNRWASFDSIPTLPPTSIPDGRYDLIYGYSVFSHLSAEAGGTWLRELARIAKPGGLVMLTTRGRDFIELAEQMRRDPSRAPSHRSPRSILQAFPNTPQSLADFDAGRFCYTPMPTPDWSYWGEAAIPRAYAETQWPKYGLEVVDFVEDRARRHQNAIIARKVS